MLNTCSHLFFEELDSTNEYVKQLGEELQPWTVVQAAYQAKGKGQRGHQWESEGQKNLLASLFFKPELPTDKQFYISKITALALVNVVAHFGVSLSDISIKWPNDIYVENKKIAGILIENTVRKNQLVNSIVGVGLNVNQTEFSKELPNPVSLKQITNETIEVNEVLNVFCHAFSRWWSVLSLHQFKSIDEAYHKYLYFREKKVLINDPLVSFTATLTKVDENGVLWLRNGKNEYHYQFGEVEIEY